MPIFLLILLCTFAISLGSLIGIFTFSLNYKVLQKFLLHLVALSSGALLGGAFIHLIPEGLEQLASEPFFITVMLTIVAYLLIEKILHWHHCHDGECKVHSFGYMNLFGDAVHNFIDGLIIAAAFITSVPLGITATIALAMHEIPQEIADFGVLIHSGFSKKKALYVNFLASLSVVLGGIVGWFLTTKIDTALSFLIPVAAGGFIYIAVSDLLPELRKETALSKFFGHFSFLIVGLFLMYIVKLVGV
jgi:zinc and cadmium transporter